MNNMVFIRTINQEVEVTESGKVKLPAAEYSPAELKSIANEINRANRAQITKLMLEGLK